MREIGICRSRLPSQLDSSESHSLAPTQGGEAAAEAAARCLGKDRVEFLWRRLPDIDQFVEWAHTNYLSPVLVFANSVCPARPITVFYVKISTEMLRVQGTAPEIGRPRDLS
jgi:hypothetical protein